MNNGFGIAVPGWFRIVAIVAILWMALGCFQYLSFVTLSEADIARMSQSEQLLTRSAPGWMTAAFAVSVWSGLAGALALVFRKRIALPLLGVSLLGVLIQQIWMWFVSDMTILLPPSGWVMPVVILVAAALLYWLAHHANRRGWLN